MKRLGLVGGTTWHSTVEYYSLINRLVNERLGGDHSADCVIASLDFELIVRNNDANDLAATGRLVVDACRRLIAAGAQGLVLCANTMHMFSGEVGALDVPMIHIGEATAAAIRKEGVSKVALLGTKYTMEMDFLRDRLAGHGIEWVIPNREDRDWIHRTIFDELGKGQFAEPTRARYRAIIDSMGVQGAILGCTEIPLLIRPGDVAIPTFDTTSIHAAAAVDWALA